MWSQLSVKYNVRADLHCFIRVIRLSIRPTKNVFGANLLLLYISCILHTQWNGRQKKERTNEKKEGKNDRVQKVGLMRGDESKGFFLRSWQE